MVDRDQAGKPIRVTGTHLDIAERKQAEETMRQAKETAEEASRLKTQFVANVSRYDIGMLLNCIMGFAEIIVGLNSLEDIHQQAQGHLQELNADDAHQRSSGRRQDRFREAGLGALSARLA